MKVTYTHERPQPYWEITADDGRWWSISFKPGEPHRGVYVITNARGSNLDPHGPTGQKLLDVVHDYDRRVAKRHGEEEAP
jgi:hypothetical protein